MNPDINPLLDVQGLTMHFPIRGGVFKRKTGVVHAVDDVSFRIDGGKTLGLVGESGCGKTTVGRSIIRLYKPTDGSIRFEGRELTGLSPEQLQPVRRNLQMMFQDPFESLNSRFTVSNILQEPFVIHRIGNAGERNKRVLNLLAKVGLSQKSLTRFPHEFSGGQRQRIGIARAIALNPKLVICDEPVSALDVSIQSQVLNLLLELQEEMGLSYLFIAHDLAVVKHISDHVAVMYLGKLAEYADADEIYENPLHPYTRALISAIPEPDPRHESNRQILIGDVPSPIHPPSGCRFHTRCPRVVERCKIEIPLFRNVSKNNADPHFVACHLVGNI